MEHHVLERPMIATARRKPSRHSMHITIESDGEGSPTVSPRAENARGSMNSRDADLEEKLYEPLVSFTGDKIGRSANAVANAAGLQENVFKNLALEAQAKRKLREVSKKITFVDDVFDGPSKKPNKEVAHPPENKPNDSVLTESARPEAKSLKEKLAMFEKISESPLSPGQKSIEDRKRLLEKPLASPTRSIAHRLPGMIGKDLDKEKSVAPMSGTVPPCKESESKVNESSAPLVEPASVKGPVKETKPLSSPSSKSVPTVAKIIAPKSPASKNESKPLIAQAPVCPVASRPVSPRAMANSAVSIPPTPAKIPQGVKPASPVAKVVTSPASSKAAVPKTAAAEAGVNDRKLFPEDASPKGVKSLVAAIEKAAVPKQPSPSKSPAVVRKHIVVSVKPASKPTLAWKLTPSASQIEEGLRHALTTFPFERSKRAVVFWIGVIWVLWCFLVGVLRMRRPAYPVHPARH